MDTHRERTSAYTDMLTGLRDLTDTTALVQFDAALDDLVASGRLLAEDATRLRYWQREALRNQADQLIATATATLAGIDAARREARQATDHATRTWADRPAAASGPTAEPQSIIDVDARTVMPMAGPATTPGATTPAPPTPSGYVLSQEQRQQQPEPTTPAPAVIAESVVGGRHRAEEPSPFGPPLFTQQRAASTPAPPAEDVLTVEATETVTPTDDEFGDAPARRRRLLVAGLTVIDDTVRGADGAAPADGHPATG